MNVNFDDFNALENAIMGIVNECNFKQKIVGDTVVVRAKPIVEYAASAMHEINLFRYKILKEEGKIE